mgnify:CR=1 FL=1
MEGFPAVDARAGALPPPRERHDQLGLRLVLDEDLLAFLEDPSVLPGGEERLELIEDTGDFEINFSDAFTEAKG